MKRQRMRCILAVAVSSVLVAGSQVARADSFSEHDQINLVTSPALSLYVPNRATRDATDLALDALDRTTTSAGVDWKNPAFVLGGGYTRFDDNDPGAFSGDEWNLNASADADICNGLIVGLSYAYSDRNGNGGGTKEDLTANSITVYVAKRIANLVNIGGSIGYTGSDHKLTGTTAANLDSDAYNVSGFVGVSKTWDKVTAGTTLSLMYNDEEIDNGGPKLGTLTGVWSGKVAYRIDEKWKASLNFWLDYVLDDDNIPGAVAPDKFSGSVGPKIEYRVNDKAKVSLGYAYTGGPNDFTSHRITGAAEFLF